GRQSASGEIFDQELLTAAHKKLPFQTWVEVTNQRNGKQVKVRINDRGPFVHGRIIDLSLAAAREIDMVRTGTDKVRLKVIEPPSPEEIARSRPPKDATQSRPSAPVASVKPIAPPPSQPAKVKATAVAPQATLVSQSVPEVSPQMSGDTFAVQAG